MLRPAYPLQTARLDLRAFSAGDLAAMYAIESRADVARYLYWEPRDEEQVRVRLEKRMAESVLEAEGGNLDLAIVWRETGALVGEVILKWLSAEHRQGEVGYVLHPDYYGKGFATEATEVLLRLGFEDLGLHRISGRLDARNLASARVLERLGMRREGLFMENEFVKGEWTDEYVYAILAAEWKKAGRSDS